MPEGRVHHPAPGTWRRRTASGVVVTAMALGVRSALEEPAGAEAVVADAPGGLPDADAPFELHFDGRGAADTWAVVRPWLRQPCP